MDDKAVTKSYMPEGQGDAIMITKAMVQAGLRELNDSGLLDSECHNSLVVRDIILKALDAGGVFYKIRAGVC